MRRHAPCRRLFPLLFRPPALRAMLAGLCVAPLFSACDSHDTSSATVTSSATSSSSPGLDASTTGNGGLATAIVPASDLSTGLNRTLATLGNTKPGDAATPEDPVQSALASLAADSRQVEPVIRYAPGDRPGDDAAQSSN